MTTSLPNEPVAGRWKVIREIGRGGMGAVYVAEHHLTGGRVALKIIYQHIAFDPISAERFKREVSFANEIGHDGIVRVFDAGVDPDRGWLFLAMELLEGETLQDKMHRATAERRSGTSTWESVRSLLAIVLAVLDPLAAAHEKGIVHRDMKPPNVFIERTANGEERVRLLDFGIARQANTESGTMTGTSLGTPSYMAPEQAMSARQVTPAADVWAVGVMLYEILAGRPPFLGETPAAVIVSACTQPHRPMREVAPDAGETMSALVDRCLAKDPSARPADASALRTVLRDAIPLVGKLIAEPPVAAPVSASSLAAAPVAHPLTERSTARPTAPAAPKKRTSGLLLGCLLLALLVTGGGVTLGVFGSDLVALVRSPRVSGTSPEADDSLRTAVATATSATPPSRRPTRETDFDGDGRPDLAIGAYGSGDVWVFAAATDTLAMRRIGTLHPLLTPGGEFGRVLEGTGDIDRDGYADLIASAPEAIGGRGAAYFYRGGAGGIRIEAPVEIANAQGGSFGAALAVGDFDGDRVREVAVGAPQANAFGEVRIFRWATPSFRLSRVVQWPGPARRFGHILASPGDVDGDGFDDLVAGAYQSLQRAAQSREGEEDGWLFVLRGSAAGPVGGTEDVVANRDGHAEAIARAGDVNGDGLADLLVGAPQNGRAFIALGDRRFPLRHWVELAPDNPLTAESSFGAALATAGDVNGDGIADVVVGAWGCGAHTGRVFLYFGGPSTMRNLATVAPSLILEGPDGEGGKFGWAVRGVGDVDLDGFDDVAIGARYAREGAGRAYLYFGSPSGLTARPPIAIEGPPAREAYFGGAVL